VLGLRLEIVHILFACPCDGRVRPVYDCFLDSITPGHRCNTGRRCPHVLAYAQAHGWRTYQLRLRAMSLDKYGVPHDLYPVMPVYLPLSTDGTRWSAMNAYTGERVLVTLHADYPHRRSASGEEIENMYSHCTKTVAWRDVPARDKWRCHCARCSGGFMTRGIVDPFDAAPLVDPKTLDSARSDVVDPHCMACIEDRVFGGCPKHRHANAKLHKRPTVKASSSYRRTPFERVTEVHVTVPKKKSDGMKTTADLITEEAKRKGA